MTETIQAIETSYAGCRFRSRLEARWAVFFNHLGIRWEYESQGYELPDGTRYLPDFHLPVGDLFVEVKGNSAALTKDGDRLRKFAAASGTHLIVLGEVPVCTETSGVPGHSTIVSVQDRTHDVVSIVVDTVGEGWGFIPLWAQFDASVTTQVRYVQGLTASSVVRDAYLAARGARFEYGEQG